MIYIGIDNGVTGTIAILTGDDSRFIKMPVKVEQSYTKTKQNITRIDYLAITTILLPYNNAARIAIERPMVNPARFKATASALRSLEAVLIAVEASGCAFSYIDSKEWQKAMLPSGVQGPADLKKASMDIGCRLFPAHKEAILKHKDADSLLIAEYLRRYI